jgi:hypothetical protein
MSTGIERETRQALDDFDDEATGSVRSLPPVSHAPEAQALPTPDHEWYVAVGGAQFGPFGTAELRGKLGAGVFPEDATVWHSGLAEWEEWGWIPDLRGPPAQPAPKPPTEGPATLSPVEQTTSAEPSPGFRGISPWYAMIAAVFLGLGVSFVVLRVVAGQNSDEPVVVATPSEPRATSAEVAVKGALRPDEVRSRLADRPQQLSVECWNQARAASQPNAPATVSLEVKLEVDATGYVTGARSVGDPPGYPGLGTCIAGRTRGWRFPTGSGPSTVTLSLGFRKD